MMDFNTRKSAGFSVIELMVTVAILAIVVSIAIPAYRNYISTSRETEGWNNLGALKLAEEEFFLENNGYFFGATTSTLESASGNLWKATGTDGTVNFTYSVTASGGGYVATATGNGTKVPTSTILTITKQ